MSDTASGNLMERYDLAAERIRGIVGPDLTAPEPYGDYFRKAGAFILLMDKIREKLEREGTLFPVSGEWKTLNRAMYEDILPEAYHDSYADPAVAVRRLSSELGPALSCLYTQIRSLPGWVFEGSLEAMVIHMELFLEVYGCFEEGNVPQRKTLERIFYWAATDYSALPAARQARRMLDPEAGIAGRILRGSDLTDPCCLYRYGIYVTEGAAALARMLAALSEEEADKIAGRFFEGYLAASGKPEGARMVQVRYRLGTERIARLAMEKLEAAGFAVVACLDDPGPNPQYLRDHQEDMAVYIDRRYRQRFLTARRKAFEAVWPPEGQHYGTLVIEAKEPGQPGKRRGPSLTASPHALRLSPAQRLVLDEMRKQDPLGGISSCTYKNFIVNLKGTF